MPRRVGAGRALALALSGEAIDAGRALNMGLCDRVVSGELLEQKSLELARQLADGPDQAIRAIKQILRTTPPTSLDDALAAERSLQRRLGACPEYREAVTAFAAKRVPNFTDRA